MTRWFNNWAIFTNLLTWILGRRAPSVTTDQKSMKMKLESKEKQAKEKWRKEESKDATANKPDSMKEWKEQETKPVRSRNGAFALQSVVQSVLQSVVQSVVQSARQSVLQSVVKSEVLSVVQSVVQSEVQSVVQSVADTKRRSTRIIHCGLYC